MIMTLYYYQATYPDQTTERRAYETPQVVGEGAVGELRYMVAIDPPPPTGDQILAAGIQIVSDGTPALNGTYGISAADQQNISGIAAGIGSRNRLPGGAATFDYGDIDEVDHTFTGPNFLNFAAAVEDFLYGLKKGQFAPQPIHIP